MVKLSNAELRGENDDRYHRQKLIAWWKQDLVHQARVLVVGAGALGNEVLKNLSLLGVGNILVYDMDVVERSNLSRAVLFREGDEGANKADLVARRVSVLNAEVKCHSRAENIIHRGGLGVFLWADVVICAVDNREARVFINSACSRMGRCWVDGAIEGCAGVVRVFNPQNGPCYECTMNDTDRQILAERRSCALLARKIAELGRVPATIISSSLIGALQVQEAIGVLHGRASLEGQGLHINELSNGVSHVRFQRRDDCPGHEHAGTVTSLSAGVADVSLNDLLARAEDELGEGAVLDFSRDIVRALSCPQCERHEPGRAPLGALDESDALCPRCGRHRIVEIASSADRAGEIDLSLTPSDLGLPPMDVIVARRGLDEQRAWLFDGDAATVLGPLGSSLVSHGRPG